MKKVLLCLMFATTFLHSMQRRFTARAVAPAVASTAIQVRSFTQTPTLMMDKKSQLPVTEAMQHQAAVASMHPGFRIFDDSVELSKPMKEQIDTELSLDDKSFQQLFEEIGIIDSQLANIKKQKEIIRSTLKTDGMTHDEKMNFQKLDKEWMSSSNKRTDLIFKIIELTEKKRILNYVSVYWLSLLIGNVFAVINEYSEQKKLGQKIEKDNLKKIDDDEVEEVYYQLLDALHLSKIPVFRSLINYTPDGRGVTAYYELAAKIVVLCPSFFESSKSYQLFVLLHEIRHHMQNILPVNKIQLTDELLKLAHNHLTDEEIKNFNSARYKQDHSFSRAKELDADIFGLDTIPCSDCLNEVALHTGYYSHKGYITREGADSFTDRAQENPEYCPVHSMGFATRSAATMKRFMKKFVLKDFISSDLGQEPVLKDFIPLHMQKKAEEFRSAKDLQSRAYAEHFYSY